MSESFKTTRRGRYEITRHTLPDRNNRHVHPDDEADDCEKQFLKLHSDGKRYWAIKLENNHGKVETLFMHELMCATFQGPKPGLDYHVHFLDGNILNPIAANLRWMNDKGEIAPPKFVEEKKGGKGAGNLAASKGSVQKPVQKSRPLREYDLD